MPGGLPRPDGGESFTVYCPVTGTGNGTCRVDSFGGFAQTVVLGCDQAPPGLSCQFSPRQVKPPAGGSVTFRLQVSSDNVAPGSYVFEVVGRSGSRTSSFTYPWTVAAPDPAPVAPLLPPPVPAPVPQPPPKPTFSIACSLKTGDPVDQAPTATLPDDARVPCLLLPKNGFSGPVTLELKNFAALLPDATAAADGVSYSIAPVGGAPQPGPVTTSVPSFDIILPAAGLKAGQQYQFDVSGTAGGQTVTRRVILEVKGDVNRPGPSSPPSPSASSSP